MNASKQTVRLIALPDSRMVAQAAQAIATAGALGNHEALQATYPFGFVRAPPPAPPAGWLDDLPDGAEVEMRHADGWWGAKIVGRRGAATSRRSNLKFLVVASEGSELPRPVGAAEHAVEPESLRPLWTHLGGKKGWRMAHDPEAAVDQSVVSDDAATGRESQREFDQAIADAKEALAPPPGAPPAPAPAPERGGTRRSARGSDGGVDLQASIELLEEISAAGRKRKAAATSSSNDANADADADADADASEGPTAKRSRNADGEGSDDDEEDEAAAAVKSEKTEERRPPRRPPRSRHRMQRAVAHRVRQRIQRRTARRWRRCKRSTAWMSACVSRLSSSTRGSRARASRAK